MEVVIDRRVAEDLAAHFLAIVKYVPLRPIRSEVDYEAAVGSLNALLDAGAADETHALADLAATLGELIGDYDDARYPAKDVAPNEMLRFLMDQHELKQTDLAVELGSQGVVSGDPERQTRPEPASDTRTGDAVSGSSGGLC